MVVRRLVIAVLLAGMPACVAAQDNGGGAPASQTDSQQQTGSTSSSSSSSVHHKTKAGSEKAVHHTRGAEPEGPPPELAKAEELIQKQDFAGAEPLLKRILEGEAGSDPASYVAWFELGFVENGLGKRDESIAAYRKAVAAKPDVFESNLNLGLQLAKAGVPEAEQFLRAATHLKPTSHVAEGQARAWLSLGHVLEASKPEEAVAAYGKAAELQPKDPEPHLAAGLVLEKQEKFADAEQEYKQALALNPATNAANSDAVTGLANIYMRGRRFPEAEAELRKLVAANPEQANAHIQLGRVLAADGKYEDAITEMQAGTKLTPADTSLQRDLADLYVMSKKYGEAEAAYRALLPASPNDAALHEGLGRSLLEQKKFADAEKEFLIAVKLKPDFGAAYSGLAFAASANKDYPLAIKVLDMRAKVLPEEAITYFMRASAYDNLKDVKKASLNYHLFLQAANGKYPDQEWQAKHRLIAIEPKK
jgi:tetratricopeptide (TPR) repeat protein